MDISLAEAFAEGLNALEAAERVAVQRALAQLARKPEGAERLLGTPERAAAPQLRLLQATPETAIVLWQEGADLLIALHAAPAAEALAWAREHRLTATAQGVLHLEPLPPPSPPAPVAAGAQGALARLDDASLQALGVPEGWEPAVRGLADAEALGELQASARLPAYTLDHLHALFAGEPLPRVLARQALYNASHPAQPAAPPSQGTVAERTVVRAALDHLAGRAAFSRPFGAAELEQVLHGPLERWRVFLHPDQAHTVERDYDGPALVLGGPGTGKTVVALHRARHLALGLAPAEGRHVVLTTYSRTLAQALEEQRDLLCGPERERIRVSTLHGWVLGLLAERGHAPRIAEAAETDALWAEAVAADTLGLAPAFYRAEWEHVVLPQDLRREEDYLRADRAGLPALPTGRAGRRAVWAVLSRYAQGLAARGLVDFDLLVRSARDRLAAGTLPVGDVAAVVVDEAQDLRSEELRFLAALLGGRRNGLFLVGDAHQRIYRSPFAMSRFGIAVEGRTTRLRLNYRSTGHILVRSLQVVSHEPVRDLDEQVQSYAGYYSLRTGREPQLLRHADPDREAGAICALLRGIAPELGSWNRVAVFARLDRQVRHLEARLRAAGIPALLLRDQARPSEPGVHLGTMHRAKGLEYPVVILAGLDQGVLPLPHRAAPGTRLAAEHLQQERNLLYVAMSRARDLLFLSCGGALSPLVAELFRQDAPGRP